MDKKKNLLLPEDGGAVEDTMTMASRVNLPLPPPTTVGTTSPQFQVKTRFLLLYMCREAPVPLADTDSIRNSSEMTAKDDQQGRVH